MNTWAEANIGPSLGLVVVAAGGSRRFGSDKLSVRLGGLTVLRRAIGCLQAVFPDAPLAVVVRGEDLRARAEELAGMAVTALVPGGARRQDSVRAGVEALGLSDRALAVIHDGARPFVPRQDIQRVVEAAHVFGAAVLSAPVSDTIKEVDAQGRVARTVPREALVRSLTPQVFRVGLLRRAWAEAGDSLWTDEASGLERVGIPVTAVPGDPRNVKVTRPEDVALLRGLFPPRLRVGQGFDVHPFVEGRSLVLAGVPIPHAKGLAGHSDADVVLHAVTDAILGACGGGDIGQHFPPSEPQWAGAASRVFVEFALQRAREAGLSVVNCDVTILCEQPRIGPFRKAMAENLAALLGVASDAVNIKATTTERLGFVGREEGVVALAVVLLAGD